MLINRCKGTAFSTNSHSYEYKALKAIKIKKFLNQIRLLKISNYTSIFVFLGQNLGYLKKK